MQRLAIQRVIELSARYSAGNDLDLLEQVIAQRSEAAFAQLMHRHGAMVLGVCRRILRHQQDAEDACQSTFLVLAQRAETIQKRKSLSSWLYGVAVRISQRLKQKRDSAGGNGVLLAPATGPGTNTSSALADTLQVLESKIGW